MSKRLTIIYEVPDDYNVTRITGTGELNVVRCESMDVMQELGKATARLAAAEDLIAHLRISEDGWISENKQLTECLADAKAARATKYRCHDCGLPVRTEQCGDVLHIHEWSLGYDEALRREQERNDDAMHNDAQDP